MPRIVSSLTVRLTTISETIVEARASNPASAIDGSRTSTRRAISWTTRWMPQNSRVAQTTALAVTENLLSTAADTMIPTAIPTNAARSRIPIRTNTRQSYTGPTKAHDHDNSPGGRRVRLVQ